MNNERDRGIYGSQLIKYIIEYCIQIIPLIIYSRFFCNRCLKLHVIYIKKQLEANSLSTATVNCFEIFNLSIFTMQDFGGHIWLSKPICMP